MLHYTNTTVFNVDVQTMVNTVNCVGVMGAGLALEFQLRFPEMERDYAERCKKGMVKIGRPYLYKDYQSVWILNFPTKLHWKHPSKLEWIEEGLKYFINNYKRGGITSIAFPRLGCSNGGLPWDDVLPLMERYLKNLDIDIFICMDQEIQATGIEAKMVNFVNNMEACEGKDELPIRPDIRQKILYNLPIKRFRELARIDGVGKQTYVNMFKFLYSLSTKLDLDNEFNQLNHLQLNLNEIPVIETKAESHVSQEMTSSNIKMQEYEESSSKDNTYDAFFILLPHIEKALSIERTKDEVSAMFSLPKTLVNDWLKKAEKLGKIKKLTRPIRYISTSNTQYRQLNVPLK